MRSVSETSLFGWKQALLAVGIPAIGGLITYTLWKRDRVESKDSVLPDYCRVEMTVPGDKVGAVIGRGGMIVREIQRTSGARVHVSAPPRPPPTDNGLMEDEKDGTVLIEGQRENVLMAEIAVRKVIAQTAPTLIENVSVPKCSIGLIIGKKGANIRELYDLSGARVEIGRTGGESEIVTIKGRPASIDIARMWLEKKVEQAQDLDRSKSTSKRNCAEDETQVKERRCHQISWGETSNENGATGDPLAL